MTQPNSGEEPTPQPNGNEPTPPASERGWLRRLRRYGLPIGGVALVGLAAGGWWGWVFVNQQLSPLIEKNLSESLKRPVKLGRVERFSLTSLRVGASEVPATATDPDRLSIGNVEVSFNPLRVLLTRNLNLGITVERPTIYLEQDKDGNWISTQIEQKEEQGPVKTEIESVQFRDAEVVLVPWAKSGNKQAQSIKLNQANGAVNFFDNSERIAYELSAKTTTGGALDLDGETLQKPKQPQQTKAEIRVQNFLVSEIDRLVKLPVNLEAGRANGTVRVEFRPDEKQPRVDGTAQFNGVTLAIPQVATKFSQASGGLQLRGTLIRLENINTLYGKVPVQAGGDIDTEKGFKLKAKVKPVSLAKVIEALNLTLPIATEGEVEADLNVVGTIDKPILNGLARSTKPGRIDQIDLSRFSTAFKLDTAAQLLTIADLQATLAGGGQVAGSGRVNLTDRPTVAFVAQLANVLTDPIVQAYAGSNAPKFSTGLLNAQALISGPADAVVVTIPQLQVNPGIGGTVTGSGKITLGDQAIVAFNTQVNNVPADPIVQSYGSALPFAVGLVNGQAQISGPADGLLISIANVQVNPPSGGVITGSGEIDAGRSQLALNVQAENLQGGAIAQAYALPFQVGTINASAQLAGSFASPSIVVRDAVAGVAGGTVSLQARLTNGNWQATTQIAQVQLSQFSQDLRGVSSGQFTASGTGFTPAEFVAQGNINLSEGLAVVRQPIAARVAWDGQKLLIPSATSPGLSVNGAVYANLQGTPSIDRFDLNVRGSDYDLTAIALPLPSNIRFSGRSDFNGKVTGTPTAPVVATDLTLRKFILNGLAFESPLVGQLRVDRGVDLSVRGRQDQIALSLNSEYLPIAFDVRQGQGQSQTIAKGTTQGDLLTIDAKNVPLSLISVGTEPIGGAVTGTVTLNARQLTNPSQLNVNGQLAIVNPSFGTYRADQFGGNVTLTNGVATLSNAQVRRGDTVFRINASSALFAANAQAKGTVEVTQGRVQDVLSLLQVFDLADLSRGARPPLYGDALDLDTTPIALAGDLQSQLRRLSEIKARREQGEAQRKDSPLPGLDELDGRFNSTVTFNGSLQKGFNATLSLRGQDWKWGSFSAQQVIADASFENGVLSLLPVRLQSGDAFVAFTGQLSAQNQSGQLRIENVPIESLTPLLPASASIDLEGKLNATATLSGTLLNPQAVGNLQLNQGVLKGTDIQSAQGRFSFQNARLNFNSSVLVQGTQPLTIVGSIPQLLPIPPVTPDNGEVQLDIKVADEGLAFLNLLNNQVAWVDGKGQVQAQVRGTRSQPIISGRAEVQNATFRATALPDLLTGVTGTVRFENDRLRVEGIQGQYGKQQGQVMAAGVLPLFKRLTASDTDAANPLRVSLNKLNLTLKGLYTGGVNGTVEVTGTALNSVIGGQIKLADGQVQLTDSPAATTPAPNSSVPPTSTPAPASPSTDSSSTVEFANLQIQLGDRIRIVRQPLINFVAAGNLAISGTLNDPNAEGTIRLTAGQVNLYTTQFNLVRGYPQTATFLPNQGIDPVLNVRLLASVAESTGYRQPTALLPSEVLDAPPPSATIGGVQTIRIQADVQGRASELSQNLTLTSRPGRSETELLALIGGSFVNTFGQGSGALGLANLAGSALLTNVQTTVGNVLGLSEFRLFPTLIRDNSRNENDRNNRRTASSIGLGVEGAIDLSPSLSLSAVGLIGSGQPTQFGLRYRLSDQFLVRGSSDFSGDNRAVLEYETRF